MVTESTVAFTWEWRWKEEQIIKGHKETFGGHLLDCDDSFMGVYVYQTFQTVHLKHVQFMVYQSYPNKIVKPKRYKAKGTRGKKG